MNVQKPDLETLKLEPHSGFEVKISRTRVEVKMSERVATICLIPLSALVLAGLIGTLWYQKDLSSRPSRQPQLDQHQQRD
jgi:hypothetical protein